MAPGALHCLGATLQETCRPDTSYRFPFRPSSPGLVNENSARETDSENPTCQDTPPLQLC